MNKIRGVSQMLYENKYFYEVVKTDKKDEFTLVGPFDNIRYAVQPPTTSKSDPSDIAYVQVIDGRVVQGFTYQEILVLDHKL